MTNALNVAWSGIRMPSSLPARQQRLRRRWGYRGVRVGEALHPGPSPGTPLHPAIGRGRSPSPPDDDPRPLRRRVAPPPDVVRCFCPVPGCGHADATRARGWGSHDAMRHHLDDHCAGTLAGAVPMEYLDAHRLDLCSVCGLLVACRFNGVHPRCRPCARQQLPNHRPAGLMDAGLPSLDSIMELDVPTLRHVPHVARSAWAQCLARAASTAAVSNTVPAWQELLMLPKAVLVAPTRGGARHHQQAALATLRRCQRWLAGERMDLWEELRARPMATRSTADSTTATQHSRCCALAAEGELSRACADLTEPARLPPSQATFEQLSAHHPQSAMPDVSRLGPARPAAVPELSSEAVIGALKTFPRASAPGPSGLRADHIKETLATAHGDEVTAHLVSLCQLLAKGEAPTVVAPYLGGARLHALPKKNGGVRPIAVGETIRRLVGKVLCHATRADSNQYFWPLQVGVGVKLGGEAAVHTARQWAERNAGVADKVLLKVDFQNAFNSVDRFALLSETRAAFPGLACWVDWCYSSASVLRFGKHTIPSTRGIQQGDPLGPLLFSAALQPALRKTAQCPVELCFSYLDDAVLAGRADAVAAAFRVLQHEAAVAGLQLEPSKCELVPLAPQADLSAFPPSFQVRRPGVFDLLGSPVGDFDHCNTFTQTERVEKAAKCLEAVAALPDPQVGLQLLRHCVSFTKMVHSMRTTPPGAHASALAAFDQQHRGCLEHLGCFPVSDRTWHQATLGLKQGGLGLRQCTVHAPAAYLASVAATHEACRSLDGRYTPDWPSSVQAAAAFDAAVLASDRFHGVHQPRQQTLSAALDKAQLAQLQVSAEGESERAHLQLLQQPGAGAWLLARPSQALGLHLDAAFFRVLLRMRLRVPVASSDGYCPLCDGIADRFGDHARACPCGGDRTKRHNRLRAVVAARAMAAGLSPEVEKQGLLPQRPEEHGASESGSRCNPSQRRPADVYIPAWGAHGPAAFDLAATSGMRGSVLPASAACGRSAATNYEGRKRAHQNTEQLCHGQGLQFVPLVVEACCGGWGPTASATWKNLGRCMELASG